MIDLIKLRALMEEQQLDAMIASSPENFCYTTGMPSTMLSSSRQSGVTSVVIPKRADLKPCLICMDFEMPAFVGKVDGFDIAPYETWIGAKDWDDVVNNVAVDKKKPLQFETSLKMLSDVVSSMGLSSGKIGVEQNFLTCAYYSKLLSYLDKAVLVDCAPLFIRMRSVKTPAEIELFRDMCRVTSDAYWHLAPHVKAGATELELLKIYRAKVFASEGMYVPCTTGSCFVLSGANGARAGLSSDKAVQDGEVIRFDGGIQCAYHFYNTDVCCTWPIGNVDKRLLEIKDTLFEAQHRAIEKMKPGVPINEIFHTAYDYVKKKYPWYERGHTGHSISMGPFGEEAPFVSPGETRPLEPGMILNIEPPCYIRGVAGFNIEDMVLVTETGVEVLTHLPHYLDGEKKR